MKSVLFVDDEPRILAGLRRMLRSMRHDWRMNFASSGAGALESMRREPFDIVVSDMKMPRMDGAELLSVVKRVWPDSVRIILSGHASAVSVLKAVGPTQRYLSKPCDPESLKATIERTWSLRALLPDRTVRRCVGEVDTLPSPPRLFRKINEELGSPHVSCAGIGEIVGQDVGMTAKILQLANSSYFGATHRIRSVEGSVAHLGVETVQTLVSGANIFAAHEGPSAPGVSLDAASQHGKLTSTFAAAIAREEKADDRLLEDSTTAGMIHDVGQLILLVKAPDRYEQIVERASREGSLAAAETKELGTTRAQVGAYLMGLWGFPDEILNAINHHARPRESPEAGFGALTIVHVANALAHESAADSDPTTTLLDAGYLKLLGLEDRLPAWRDACRRCVVERSECEVGVR